MNKKTKWILISVGILTVLLLVLSKAGVFGKAEGTEVTTEKAAVRTVIETVNASGKIYPEEERSITPTVSGEITQLLVAEGDTVKKGQMLARIYADEYSIQSRQAASGVAQSRAQAANAQAALEGLRANMDQAQRAYDMQKKLFDEKVISRNEFNTAEAALRSAQASFRAAEQGLSGNRAAVSGAAEVLAKANAELGRTALTAPMDGVITLLSKKQGEGVAGNAFNVGTEIMRIANLDKIEVRVDVGENDIPKVKVGDSAIVKIDAYSDRKFKGIVTQIAGSSTGVSSLAGAAASGTDVTQYKVHILLLKESYLSLLGKGSFPFRPGMTANADIQTKTVRNVVSVPINAVTTRDRNDSTGTKATKVKSDDNADEPTAPVNEEDNEIVVFIRGADGKVTKSKVATGIQDISYIQVLSGVKAGDEVITGPYDVVSKTLKTGDKVKPVEKDKLFGNKD